MDPWRKAGFFAAGAAAVIVGGALAAVGVSVSGLFDVSAATPHLPLVGRFVHRTMIESVERRADDVPAPPAFTAANVLAGFCEYRRHCEMCHGGPAVGRPHWVNGMDPAPPYLVGARTRWSTKQLYWIVANGIKMTAMPSWKGSMSKEQMWNTVAFVEALPQLPSPTYDRWARASSCKPQNAAVDLGLPPAIGPAEPPSEAPTHPVRVP